MGVMHSATSEIPEGTFRSLVEQTLAGIYIAQSGKFRYVNPQFARIFGYDAPDEIIDRVPMTALVSDQDMEMVYENVRLRASGEVEDMRYRFMAKRKDGSHFHVEVHGRSASYNDEPAVMGVVIDVTAQVEAERHILERDRKIRALFSDNVIGILSWDSGGFIHDANPVFREMLGLLDTDFADPGLSWKSITPPEYYDICTEHVGRIMSQGRGTPVQKEYIARTGERIPVLVNGVRYGEGDYCGISFVLDLRNIQRIQSERDMLASMVEWAPAVMFVQDLDGRFIYLNKAAQAKAEPFGGLAGKTEFDYMDAETASRVAADRQRIIATGELEQYEEEIRYQIDSNPMHFRTTKWPVHDIKGKAMGLAGVVVNITAQKKAQADLARSKNLISAVFENMPGLALLRDAHGCVVSFNSLFASVSGLNLEEAEGKPICELLPQPAWEVLSRHDQHVLSTVSPYLYEGDVDLGNGITPYLISLFPIFDEQGKASGLGSLLQSQEEIRQAQSDREALLVAEYQAQHDPLTELPNRTLLFNRLEQLIFQGQLGGAHLVVCFLDLDGFKQVNDTHGHGAGDQLLKIVAERMAGCIRNSDMLARIGGDEFVVLLHGDPDSSELTSVIRRLCEVVAEPVSLEQGRVQVSCSIGYAVYPRDGAGPSELLSYADMRMYEQKAKRSRSKQSDT